MSINNYCDHPSKPCDTFYFTGCASYLATTGGIISAVSSLIVLIVVYRSEIRFRSVYNRIMMCMAIFDFISSVALSFTTIPMPRDAIYPFKGKGMLGNVLTCEVQGFATIFGYIGSFLMNCGLNIFYISIIQFRISDLKMRRYLEPSILILAWSCSAGTAMFLLIEDLFNPGPYESWCTVATYPDNCSFLEDNECIRGSISPGLHNLMRNGFFLTCSFGALTIIACMCTILFGPWKNAVYFPAPNVRGHVRDCMTHLDSWRSMNKVLTRQALMYIGAFIFTYIFAVIGLLVRNDIIDALYCIFFPLQGFFNCLIFISHKIQNIKRSDSSIDTFEALMIVLIHPSKLPEIRISGISLVKARNMAGSNEVSRSSCIQSAEDASRDVHRSCYSIPEEMSNIFDISYSSRQESQNNELSLEKEYDNDIQNSEEDSLSDIVDNDSSLPMHSDDSTVKATSRWRNV